MALINTGSDPWLLEYNACEALSRDIMEQLHARDNEHLGSSAYDSLSGKARVRLKQYSNEIAQLRNKLQLPSVVSPLTSEEKERRLRQVEQLQSRFLQLERSFERSSMKPSQSGNRNAVLDMGTTGWGGDDDDDDEIMGNDDTLRNVPITDIRERQTQMLREQDAGLEELSQVIARQKRVATAIYGEVDDQNEILDDISNNMDRVNTRVNAETDLIRTIGRKDATCGYWVIIVILLIIIIAVSLA